METIEALKNRLTEACPTLELREHEPMSRHTTFRVGGPVTLMALPKSRQEAITAIREAAAVGIIPFYLGKGSNLLVSDAGIDGFVIKNVSGADGIRQEDERTLYVESGVSLAQAAVYAMERGLSGMEFAHGIPGTLGGAVWMNAGAYDGEMSQIVTEAHYVTREGESHCLPASQLGFGYRHSVFSDSDHLILGARLVLTPGEREAIQQRMAQLMEQRRAKQPLEFPSGGSTFKRPPGHFAGALIEGCGLKGARVGDAQVSEKHAGFVINLGGASCEDVLGLMTLVRKRVLQETGVLLEPELRLIGCQLEPLISLQEEF
jgi:UDP-N-acetylmuramate dehydrogenase